jgi:periplasmic protein TonB
MAVSPPDRANSRVHGGTRYELLTDTPPIRGRRSGQTMNGLTVSLALHAGALALVGLTFAHKPSTRSSAVTPVVTRLVWTAQDGGSKPGSTSGGQDTPKLARPAQLVGRDAIALPSAPPRLPDRMEPQAVPEVPRLVLPDQEVAAGLKEMIGTVSEVRPLDLDARGPGAGVGVDGGDGSRSGTGDRDGLGDGSRPGAGEGDDLKPGNGVSWPRLVQEVKPNYTAGAMHAHVEGLIELEIVVLPDGSVGRVNIVRSLDARFGLDQEAVNAVRRWRFEPGRRSGKAVAVRVGVELSFNLR